VSAEEQIPVVPDNTVPGLTAGAAESRYAVTHSHTISQCVGYLYVSPTRIRFEVIQPALDKGHSFDLLRSDFTAIQLWTLLGTPLNAVELKTARNNYHFSLLPDNADLANIPSKQWNLANALPANTLLAALKGQAGGTVAGVPSYPINTASAAPYPGAYPSYPAFGGVTPAAMPNTGNPTASAPYPGQYPTYPGAGVGVPVAAMPNAGSQTPIAPYPGQYPSYPAVGGGAPPPATLNAGGSTPGFRYPEQYPPYPATGGDVPGAAITGIGGLTPAAPYPGPYSPYPVVSGVASPSNFNVGGAAAGVPYPEQYPTYPAAGVGGPVAAMPNLGSPIAATSAQSAPELRYNPPANFYRSASRNPEDYSSGQVNASMQVYPFRPLSGDISQQFQRTLLREWIDPRYQESNVAASPSFSRVDLMGAQTTLVARFIENVAGTMKEHMRVAIVANGAAAVVDLSANSATSWQSAAPAMLASLNSATVVQSSAAANERDISLPGSSDASFGGLYMALKQRYMAALFGLPGTGGYVTAQHFFLLAPDGRMYRTYDAPPGDVRSFDYASAQRNDPENSGRWVRRGNQIVIQFSGPQPEQAVGAISAGGGFTMAGLLYEKQN